MLEVTASPQHPVRPPHLGPAHADDAVDVTVGVVEEGHADSMLAGWDPVPLGGGVYLEDVRPGAEDGLLPGGAGRQIRPPSHNVAGRE